MVLICFVISCTNQHRSSAQGSTAVACHHADMFASHALSLQVPLLVYTVVACELRQTLAYLLVMPLTAASVQC
jgi:hypothetical protein